MLTDKMVIIINRDTIRIVSHLPKKGVMIVKYANEGISEEMTVNLADGRTDYELPKDFDSRRIISVRIKKAPRTDG